MAWALHEDIMKLKTHQMKKYTFIIIAAALTITAFAFTNKNTGEDVELKQYDQKIETLKKEIQELNKNGTQRAAILDSLLNTI